jgi:hypothetical protein
MICIPQFVLPIALLLRLFPDIVLNRDGAQVEASVDGSMICTGRAAGAPVSAARFASGSSAIPTLPNGTLVPLSRFAF